MLIALIIKELGQAARDRTIHLAMTGFLLAFLITGLLFISDFLSAGSYPFEEMAKLLFLKISILQGALLALLTPWIALRIQDRDLSGEYAPLGAGILATPFQIVISKLISFSACLIIFILLTLPVFCLARLLGAAGIRQIGWVLSETLLFLLYLSVLIFHLRLLFRNWLVCWILSYVALILSAFIWQRLWISIGGNSCTLLFGSLLLLLVVLLFPHGNRTLLYERN
jgi:hypothetical protein